MGTHGHSLSIHADAEQGSPSATAEGESTEAEEEPNGHEFEWLKAMNNETKRGNSCTRKERNQRRGS